MKLYDYILVALFAAITVCCSQISFYIPFMPVPFSMSLLAVFSCGAMLGFKRAVLSQVIYLLLGAIGLPVFAGFRGGLFVLTGPTGGFLMAYIVLAGIVGLYSDKFNKFGMLGLFGAMLLGLTCLYAVGATQLSFVTQIKYIDALKVGVLPFILFDALKAFGAACFCLKVNLISIRNYNS